MQRNLATALAIGADLVAIAAAAAMVPGTAYADDITIDTTPFTSTKTRAEVQAELMDRSLVAGSGASDWAMQYNQPQVKSAYTSEQAKAEYKVSRQYVSAVTGEDSGSAYFIKQPVQNHTTTMGGPAR